MQTNRARRSLMPAILAALCLSGLALPTSAQIVPTGTPAADILLSLAIAERPVFLTGSALDPATHARSRFHQGTPCDALPGD